jgi:lysine-N-methylase
MAAPGVVLPVIQNWSCHNCGGCCREHQIGVTDEEKSRIERQNWTAADGIITDRPLIVPLGNGWRLNHQSDGACVFLDPQGLCRMHAKFGESSKPLACRTYPYAVHPAGTSVTVSLRFSCPSVVQNIGRPVPQQRQSIEQLVSEIVPGKYRAGAAPDLTTGRSLSWSQLQQIQAWLLRSISAPGARLTTRVLRTLAWVELLEQAPADGLGAEHLGSLLKLLHEAAARAIPEERTAAPQPKRLARLMFRQFVAQLLRHDTDLTARSGVFGRLRLLLEGVRFTFGIGRVPRQTDPVSVRVAFPDPDAHRGPEASGGHAQAGRTAPRFSDLESPCGGRLTEIDDLLTRYWLVKLEGLHFCGAAFYGMSVVDGIRSLALMTAAIHWAARYRARRRGATEVSLIDVQAALATLDHNFGYSPVLGLRSSRNRIVQLAKLEQISVLLDWYSQ